jgi:hypothetical protein
MTKTADSAEFLAKAHAFGVQAGEFALGSKAALAEYIETHRSQVTRAARGQEIGAMPGWRMAGLAAVIGALLEIYEPAAVGSWLHGINPHLNNQRPLDVLKQGDVAAVMRAVQADRTGAFA